MRGRDGFDSAEAFFEASKLASFVDFSDIFMKTVAYVDDDVLFLHRVVVLVTAAKPKTD